jgi:hypothetical protein
MNRFGIVNTTENCNTHALGAGRVGIPTREELLRILASYDTQPRDGGKAKTGFREWAECSYNIANGCSHNCRYCVQRQNGVRHGDQPSRAAWSNERLRDRRPSMRKFEGPVMFPSAHDITPPLLGPAIAAIQDLLAMDNEVLIVSKPHMKCITEICKALRGFEQQILFRFTIGTFDKELAKFWEPGAPDPSEREACLEHAQNHGFQTSVSMEPMLAGSEDAIKTCHRLLPLVTETIWLGKMNRKAVFGAEVGVKIASRHIRDLQSDDAILELVSRLGGEPKVRWKDSIREVIRRHVS